MRVLIVEDETIIRLDLKALLERSGIEVCGEARDGEEAVELARELEPDLALIDVRMRRLDGIEASRRILAERPIPIVLLTAFSDRQMVERAVAAGISAYLVKPFREPDLLPAIRTATARHAELLDARRQIGARPPKMIELEVHSRSGQTWPLRIGRLPGGSIELDANLPPASDRDADLPC
jgi:DNA-binding NarL/FixJ family response regulator